MINFAKLGKKSAAPKGAKARLKNMETREVSLVDRGANLRDFVIRKAADLEPVEATAVMRETIARIAAGDLQTSDDGPVPEWLASLIRVHLAEWDRRSETLAVAKRDPVPSIALPAAARTELIDLALDALERFALVTAMLQSSTVDESASVPRELLQIMHDVGADLVRGSQLGTETDDSDDDDDESETTAKAHRSRSPLIDDETAETLEGMKADMVETAKQRDKARRFQSAAARIGEVLWPDDMADAVAKKEPAPPGRFQWPDDMSEHVMAKGEK